MKRKRTRHTHHRARLAEAAPCNEPVAYHEPDPVMEESIEEADTPLSEPTLLPYPMVELEPYDADEPTMFDDSQLLLLDVCW